MEISVVLEKCVLGSGEYSVCAAFEDRVRAEQYAKEIESDGFEYKVESIRLL